jgi:hypothetical protein
MKKSLIVASMIMTTSLTACGEKAPQEFFKNHPSSTIVFLDFDVCEEVSREIYKISQMRVRRNEPSIQAFGKFWNLNSKGQGVNTHCFKPDTKMYRKGNTQSYVEVLDGTIIREEVSKIKKSQDNYQQDRSKRTKEQTKDLL